MLALTPMFEWGIFWNLSFIFHPLEMLMTYLLNEIWMDWCLSTWPYVFSYPKFSLQFSMMFHVFECYSLPYWLESVIIDQIQQLHYKLPNFTFCRLVECWVDVTAKLTSWLLSLIWFPITHLISSFCWTITNSID